MISSLCVNKCINGLWQRKIRTESTIFKLTAIFNTCWFSRYAFSYSFAPVIHPIRIAVESPGSQLALLLPVVTAGLALAVAVIKPLNLLLLGENYARTMGLNVQRTRTLIFLSTVLLAGTVTAFCGPVGFIGLAVPHLARMLFASADHRILMPGSMLAGAALLLVCDLVAKSLALPINTITALMGIPVVIFVVVRNRNIF